MDSMELCVWSISWCLFRVSGVCSAPKGHSDNKRQVGEADIWPYGQTPAVHRGVYETLGNPHG